MPFFLMKRKRGLRREAPMPIPSVDTSLVFPISSRSALRTKVILWICANCAWALFLFTWRLHREFILRTLVTLQFQNKVLWWNLEGSDVKELFVSLSSHKSSSSLQGYYMYTLRIACLRHNTLLNVTWRLSCRFIS